MFGIIILLETIPTIWLRSLRVRQQHITKNLINVKFFLHNAREDQDWCCTSGQYSGPNVNFKGVLALWSQLRWSAVFSKADLPMMLQPYSTLVCEDDIFKFLVLQTLLSEGKAGDRVCFSDHLAILRATFFLCIHWSLISELYYIYIYMSISVLGLDNLNGHFPPEIVATYVLFKKTLHRTWLKMIISLIH